MYRAVDGSSREEMPVHNLHLLFLFMTIESSRSVLSVVHDNRKLVVPDTPETEKRMIWKRKY